MVGREDAVVVAAGRRERAGVDNCQTREKPRREPVLITVFAQSLLSPTRVPAHVGGNGDGFGSGGETGRGWVIDLATPGRGRRAARRLGRWHTL
ncbi:MAG TPA: hypothetical protein VI094_08685 [Propionibacteriaceae bacterium]